LVDPLGYGLVDRCSVPDRGQESFHFSIAFTPALGHTRSATHCIPGVVSLRLKPLGRGTHHSSPSSAEVKHGGAISPLPIYLKGMVLNCTIKYKGYLYHNFTIFMISNLTHEQCRKWVLLRPLITLLWHSWQQNILKDVVFWNVALCRYFVNRCFGETSRLYLQRRKIRERGTSVIRSVQKRSTQRHIPEEGILHSRRSENHKYHKIYFHFLAFI
jgi:hypothetical protein